MADLNAPVDISPIPSFCRSESFRKKYREIDNAIRRDDESYLRSHLEEVVKKKLDIHRYVVRYLLNRPWPEEFSKEKACAETDKEIAKEKPYAVNLSGDPLLSVLISYEKTKLAKKLLEYVDEKSLLDSNLQGNNALHVAATVGDKVKDIVDVLITKNEDLLSARNEDQETPLQRAALCGQRDMFWKLYDRGDPDAIMELLRNDGTTVLHFTIIGNAPVLALEIAEKFPRLLTRRNTMGVTPLQLMMTTPGAFKSQMEIGPLGSFIYKCIPIDGGDKTGWGASFPIEDAHDPGQTAAENQHDEENPPLPRRKTFPPNYATMLNLFKTTKISARCANLLIFGILKRMFPRIEYLEQQKRKHIQTIALIECLARDENYWDFIGKGITGQFHERRSSNNGKPPIVDEENHDGSDDIQEKLHMRNATDTGLQRRNDSPLITGARIALHEFVEKILKVYPPDTGLQRRNDSLPTTGARKGLAIGEFIEKILEVYKPDTGLQRWNDSPLITGAKMGLYEFVEKILEVYPQSVNILDDKGMNIIQVAIPLGQQKILEMVAPKLTGRNPELPSRLLYARDVQQNTILHYAAEVTVAEGEATAIQMQSEMQWFEKIEKLIPKDLQYSRNAEEMTAHELFSEKHKIMAREGKKQLIQLGQTCSGLVAAFVFASSFSLPGSDNSGGGEINNKAAFKVFKHAFVFGLSCASTALVLFLSLVISSYREREFRRSLPAKFFFAALSFILALISLLVAFSCNIFLQIYSGRKIDAKALFLFVFELTFFPAITWLVLFYMGCSFGVIPLLRQVWR